MGLTSRPSGFFRKAENLRTPRVAPTPHVAARKAAQIIPGGCLLILITSRHFEGMDSEKLLKLAVIHDLGEAVCGDIPATRQGADSDKSGREKRAMSKICSPLPQETAVELLDF